MMGDVWVGVLSGCALLSGCVPGNHPLSDNGAAEFLFDARPLYAADVIDAEGQPVLPRQDPFEKTIQIFMTHGDAPDRGAYVDVQVSPPGVLHMLPIDDTCEQLPGAFRCTAEKDGFANLMLRSESDWSGEARLTLVGRSNTNEQAIVTVNPAGLPEGQLSFALLMEGTEVIPRTFASLDCILTPVPDEAFDKWPAGKTRVREAEVRATPPPGTPGVIDHAPVIVQSFHPEVFVTRDPTCPEPRTSRLRVQLDDLGRSPKFYFCFSDIGGTNVRLSAVSGFQASELDVPEVEPEARLLRVVTIPGNEFLFVTDQIETVEVSAFNANLEKISFTVDVSSSNTSVLGVANPTEELPGPGQTLRILTTGNGPGTARIRITPELFDEPRCESIDITVLP